MKNTMRALACSFLVAGLLAPPVIAQDEKALKKDLTAVIALNGLPCGEVTDVQVQAERDYLASCKDGNKYRVHENDKGRVVVEKK